MSETLLYVKTPKGIEEITSRKYALPARQRQVLVMLDGKRSRGEIADLLPGGEAESLLEKLISGDFIVPLQTVAQAELAAGAPPAKTAAPQDDAERFEMAKNFMRNTVQTFLGVMGSGFISQVNKCTNFDDLRRNFGAWKEAMMLTGDGRKQLADLESRLAALLS